MDAAGAEGLFRALVESDTELRALRERPDLEIVSLAINGERVDVVARADHDEWRVVFFVEADEAVYSVSIFQRPAELPTVPGGRALVVNGPSSAGKSTLLRELKIYSNIPWVTFDEPMFGSVGIEFLIWRERAEPLHRGFLAGIAALARAGNSVALAAGGHPSSWFDEAFVGVPTLRVGLYCPLDELERRERSRSDIPGGWAESSLAIHHGWAYDLEFLTDRVSSGEIARQVLRAFAERRLD